MLLADLREYSGTSLDHGQIVESHGRFGGWCYAVG